MFDVDVLEVLRFLAAILAFLMALVWLWKDLHGRPGRTAGVANRVVRDPLEREAGRAQLEGLIELARGHTSAATG